MEVLFRWSVEFASSSRRKSKFIKKVGIIDNCRHGLWLCHFMCHWVGPGRSPKQLASLRRRHWSLRESTTWYRGGHVNVHSCSVYFVFGDARFRRERGREGRGVEISKQNTRNQGARSLAQPCTFIVFIGQNWCFNFQVNCERATRAICGKLNSTLQVSGKRVMRVIGCWREANFNLSLCC